MSGHGVGEHLPWAIPNQDHRGTGETPPRIYLIRDDYSIERGRPTTWNQTTSPWTPCPSCLYSPQERQQKSVLGGQKCVWQPNLPQEGCASGVGCVHTAGVTRELSPEMEATLGEESRPEPLSVAARQEKLLEKLNLDGLAHWSPENAVAARGLVLAYHDVFALESNELGCTSTIEHEIRIKNDEPFKERFRCIPPPLLEDVRYVPLSGIRWKQGQFIWANPHGATQLSWSRRRMVPCVSAWTSDASMSILRKIRTPCHKFRRPWRAWWGWHISHRWISSQAFGRSRWPWDHNSTRPSPWGTSGSTSLHTCPLGCATHRRHSSISCRTP